jgi:hypothetical protein
MPVAQAVPAMMVVGLAVAAVAAERATVVRVETLQVPETRLAV